MRDNSGEEAAMCGIFNKIQGNMPEFTNSEKKVARFILKEKQAVTNMTILDISQGASVSEASVMRFCNKLGIKKLMDLKIQIAKDAGETVHRGNDIFSIQEQELVEVIRNTSRLLDKSAIEKVVDLIEKSRKVYFFGIAASGISAQVGEDSFQRMGKQAIAVTEGHFQLLTAATMNREDLVIVLSLSGNTRDVYEACTVAEERGAFIVAITSYGKSHIAKLADIVLLSSAQEDLIDGGKMSGYISQFCVLDCLKREYAMRNAEAVAQVKELLGKAVLCKKY